MPLDPTMSHDPTVSHSVSSLTECDLQSAGPMVPPPPRKVGRSSGRPANHATKNHCPKQGRIRRRFTATRVFLRTAD
ncbi:hypothetical protein PUN28_006425 [Cardiocondyla obscurior]|uniref:Uncharacterized protein n=1 Tax=Cardiocondyla obscurior TaxID=286306 RepID=A0AAW2G8K8_9HYME